MLKSMDTFLAIRVIVPSLNNNGIFTPGMAPACFSAPFSKHYMLNFMPGKKQCHNIQLFPGII